MRYLSGDDLFRLTAPNTLIAAVEQSLRDYAAGKVTVPVRQHVDFGANTLLSMPVVGEGAFGVKVVSVAPGNAARQLPIIQGLMTLSDRATGVPLAILDAAMLTAQRTGAVGAVGLKYTTPADVDCLGVIGTGVQGVWQAIFACAVRNFSTLCFTTRSDEKARRFVAAVTPHVPSVRLVRCGDVMELLARAQVVSAATTSSEPVLPAEREVLRGKHFISIGSFKPSMQELPDEVYALAGHAVIDSEAARNEVGDLIAPLASGILREQDVIHIAELVTGGRAVDIAGTTVFKSVGMALYDLYAAQTFYAEACRRAIGQAIGEAIEQAIEQEIGHG